MTRVLLLQIVTTKTGRQAPTPAVDASDSKENGDNKTGEQQGQGQVEAGSGDDEIEQEQDEQSEEEGEDEEENKAESEAKSEEEGEALGDILICILYKL